MHIHRFQRRHHILGISDLRMNDPELTLFNEPTCKKTNNNKTQQACQLRGMHQVTPHNHARCQSESIRKHDYEAQHTKKVVKTLSQRYVDLANTISLHIDHTFITQWVFRLFPNWYLQNKGE